MSLEEVDAIIAPKSESKDLVLEWLGEHGLAADAAMTPRGNVILVNATVAQAETLLGAEYKSYGK